MAITNVYLKLKDIDGESVDKGHEDWIEISSFSWGVDNPASFSIGQGGQATQSHIAALHLQKYTDKSSVTLFQAATTGKHIDDGILSCMKLDGDDRVEYLRLDLDDIMVSGLSWSGSGGDLPVHENLSLVFARFKQKYKGQKDAGGEQGVKDFGWDIQKSIKI